MFKGIAVLFFLGFQVQAMQIGELVIGGTGCFRSTRLVSISGIEGRYAIPLRVRVNKKSETTFERKSCQIRLPISLGPQEKLQVTDLSQVVRVVSHNGANVKTSLSLGLVGRSSQTLSFEMKASEDEPAQIENLKWPGLVSESGCGGDVMLTGNLNALSQGEGLQAFISTGTALVSLKVLPCAASDKK